MILISLDKNLFLAINGFVGKVTLFDHLVQLAVNEYFVPATLSLIIFYLWYAKRKNYKISQKALPIAFFSVIVTNLIFELSNHFIIRSRPFAELPTNLLFYKPTDPSFPSNAAAVSFVLATAIFLADRRFGVFSLLLASFYSFSRVYAGVHFPLDVIAGALSGILITFLFSRLSKFIEFTNNLARAVQDKFWLSID